MLTNIRPYEKGLRMKDQFGLSNGFTLPSIIKRPLIDALLFCSPRPEQDERCQIARMKLEARSQNGNGSPRSPSTGSDAL
jgi:hypothetical protein